MTREPASRRAIAYCCGVVLSLVLLVAPSPAALRDSAALWPTVAGFFPAADRMGAFEGEPAAAAVFAGSELLGYAFLTNDVKPIPAYSGKPIDTLVGIDLDGTLRGLEIVAHEEPILVIGISDADLGRYVDQYRGQNIADRVKIGGMSRPGVVAIDGISGATITVMVINASVMRSARAVAQARGIPRPAAGVAAPAAPSGAAAPQLALPDADDEPIWRLVWRERHVHIALLSAGLLVLTAILVFQDWLACHPTLLKRVRTGFLIYTLLFIGWYALGQLSVVNVFTFAHSIITEFNWSTFLADPMLFVLWAFVAVTLLLWGRGVYCGWLCPFGALQELIHIAAKRLGLKSVELPDAVHERLWAVKYVILLLLFGVSLQSLTDAERLAEVEPFKTAIVLHFQREWPFVAYALGLLALSAFNHKFYCRYLCALGAALTIPGKFRVFDWLRRRNECGQPCQICANECEVRAIRPTGEINANECHYCLDCQVTYWDSGKCLALVGRRKRREMRGGGRAVVRAPERAGAGAAPQAESRAD